jgi:hypothetical protein
MLTRRFTPRLTALHAKRVPTADAWEREGDDPTYFFKFSPRGYAFGINAILYRLTH